MIFNLIPIPPLDGSRVLYALAPDFARDIMNKMEKYGFIVVIMLVVVFSTSLTNVISGIENEIVKVFMGIFSI